MAEVSRTDQTWLEGWEILIADSDELDIEANLVDSTMGDLFYRDGKDALKKIDELRANGTYDAERARLQKILMTVIGEAKEKMADLARGLSESDLKYLADLSNFMAGLRSPDKDQRSRFQEVYERDGFAEKHPRETQHILALAERAKKPGGAPRQSPPWRKVNSRLLEMMPLVASGMSPAAAAGIVVGNLAGGENRAHYLADLFREKMKLRE